MSRYLIPGTDYTLSGAVITFTAAPLDYQQFEAHYEVDVAAEQDLHAHRTEQQSRWQGGASWTLTGTPITNSLEVFSGGCGYPHQHQVDNLVGTGAQLVFTLSSEPLRNPLVTVAGVFQRLTTHYSYTGTTLTFASAPANGAAIVVSYVKAGAAAIAPPHFHQYESRSTWSGGTLWPLASAPDMQTQALYKTTSGGVTTLLTYLTDYWFDGKNVLFRTAPTNGDTYSLFYSMCVSGALPGTTAWDGSEGTDVIGGYAPGTPLIAEQGGFPYVGVAGVDGGFNLPLSGGASAPGPGSAGSFSITNGGTGVRKGYTYFVATLYLQRSDNTLWKLINSTVDTTTSAYTTAPKQITTIPALVGNTYIRCAHTSNQIAYAFDTGLKANTNVYKTTDGGGNWTTLQVIPGNVSAGRFISPGVVHPNDANTVYCILNQADGGIFKTTDGGATWTRVLAKNWAQFGERDFISINPNDPQNVVAANRNAGEVYVTQDGGASWTTLGTLGNARFASFLWEPAGSVFVMGGNFQGRNVYLSTDKGVTWSNPQGITFDPNMLVSNDVSNTLVGQRSPSAMWVAAGTGLFASVLVGMWDAMPSALKPTLLMGLLDTDQKRIYRSFDAVTWALHYNDANTWITISVV